MPPATLVVNDPTALTSTNSSTADRVYAPAEYSFSSSAQDNGSTYFRQQLQLQQQQQQHLFLNGNADVSPSLPTPPSSTNGYSTYPLHQQDYITEKKMGFIGDSQRTRFERPLQNLFSLLRPELSENVVVVVYCAFWYVCSALTSNSGKQILDIFPFPVTLTFVQFGLVGLLCYATAALSSETRIQSLNTRFITAMAPLSLFLVGGHVFTSVAMSRIPISLVHTVKALSPLFTVLIYRFVFQAKYTSRVYVSLLPLIIGVILTCTFSFSNNLIGLVCAFLSCLVFVTQNIYNKKVLLEGDHKLPRLQVLCYLSSMAFVVMLPLWIYSDGARLVAPEREEPVPVWLFLLNGATNFGQSYFAFATLEKTSPVTYSVASLVKRIIVIVVSILWFGQQVLSVQAIGILLTFVGLWMYQNAKSDVDRSESKAKEKTVGILPMTSSAPLDHRSSNTTMRFWSWMTPGHLRFWNNASVRGEKIQ